MRNRSGSARFDGLEFMGKLASPPPASPVLSADANTNSRIIDEKKCDEPKEPELNIAQMELE